VKTEHGKTIQMEAVDALSEVIGTWHYGSNNGDMPAEIIEVYSDIEGQPVTVKRDSTHGH
jgi:quercetin dioxygenase-like cupin family protein